MAGEVLHVTTRIRSLIERSQTFVLEFRGGRFVKNTIVREVCSSFSIFQCYVDICSLNLSIC